MTLPTFSQIVTSMIDFLQQSRPDIATQTGSVTNDVVISTVANQLSAEDGTDPSVYSAIQYDQNLTAFVVNAATLVPADLDAIGTNYGAMRNPGTQATGNLTLRIRNYTTSSIIITVPSGTTVSTLSTSSAPAVSFSTTATVTFIPSLAPSYYNPSTGFYEQSVGIVCQSIGTVGNVAANTITSLVGPGLGIDAVTNTAATFGGTNLESNTAFAARIQIKLSGNNVGTSTGIVSLVETNPQVIQASIVGPNDPAMMRNQFGGSVNVYIRGQVLVTTVDTFTYSTTGSQQYVMLNQPVDSVGSVTGIAGSVPYTFIPVTDYTIVLNPNSLFAGSVDSGSYIQWTTTGTHPDNNTVVSVNYTYDSLIQTLQALLNTASNNIVGSDILIYEATEALINFTAGIVVVPGYVPTTVMNNVSTALSNYINGLGLGAVVVLSELVSIMQGVAGVSEVDLSSLILQSVEGAVTVTIPPGQQIAVGNQAYTVANTLTINIES
jgi:uncharacterized phage protein gp47/JayE